MRIEINEQSLSLAIKHRIVKAFGDGTMEFDKDFMVYLEEHVPTVMRKRKDDPSKLVTYPLIIRRIIMPAVKEYVKDEKDWPYCAAVAVIAWETFFQVKWERMIAGDELNISK